jgi:transposase
MALPKTSIMDVLATTRPDLVALVKARLAGGMSVEQAARQLSEESKVRVGREVLRTWLKRENDESLA